MARVDVASVVWYKATVATYNNNTTRRFIPDTSGDPPRAKLAVRACALMAETIQPAVFWLLLHFLRH